MRNYHQSHKRSWASPETREREAYAVAMNAMKRLFPKAPVGKFEWEDWLEHRRKQIAVKKDRLQHAVEIKEAAKARGGAPVTAFGGHKYQTNRGPVLCEFTIWCDNWKEKKEMAPWPSVAEMKWEGDDRAKTQVGRFLALPREPANANVAWHHLSVLPSYPLDNVRIIPTLEDIYLPVDEIDEDKVPGLLNSDLLEEIDSGGIF